ncbi:hypothetical protein ACFWP2_37975 [Kitasatospora sp. NPDC058444]|uniref:hypothetical protein n=1 Tax=Kitasatospora sp. NPDC058444 TaxID=3346504 RepID=UPI00364CB75A
MKQPSPVPISPAPPVRAARQAARTHGSTPAQRTVRPLRPTAAACRGPREPELLSEMFLALVAARGWTLGSAGGGLRDR